MWDFQTVAPLSSCHFFKKQEMSESSLGFVKCFCCSKTKNIKTSRGWKTGLGHQVKKKRVDNSGKQLLILVVGSDVIRTENISLKVISYILIITCVTHLRIARSVDWGHMEVKGFSAHLGN